MPGHLLDQLVLPPVQPDVDGGIARQPPDETVDVAAPVGRLEGDAQRLLADPRHGREGQLEPGQQVADAQALLPDLQVGGAPEGPQPEEEDHRSPEGPRPSHPPHASRVEDRGEDADCSGD